jgi:hypothetical protein
MPELSFCAATFYARDCYTVTPLCYGVTPAFFRHCTCIDGAAMVFLFGEGGGAGHLPSNMHLSRLIQFLPIALKHSG